MKRTRSMIIAPSDEARELMLFVANTEVMYNKAKYVVNALKKHYKRGNYSADRAVDAYYNVVTEAAKLYKKWYDGDFSVTDRFNAAVELEEYFREDVEEV